jgi:predicted AAA+ superfamily ATPase
LNASAIGQDLGLGSNHTVNDRINDLALASQTRRCHRSDGHGRPNTGAQRKVYFVDPLIARLASRRHAAYPPPDVTKLSEQQIGLALALAVMGGRADRFVAGDAVMYERTATGREIDCVGGYRVPIESKYVERNWKSQARTIGAAHGSGIFATRNLLDTDGEIWVVPACILAWLLGT